MKNKVIENVSQTITNAEKWFNIIKHLITSFVAYNDFNKETNTENLVRFMEILGGSEVYPIQIKDNVTDLLDNTNTYVTYIHKGNLTFTIRAYRNMNIIIEPEIRIRACGEVYTYNINTDTLKLTN